MIHALDHIVLAAKSPDAAVAGYEALLGRRADRASFQLANVRLDLRAFDHMVTRAKADKIPHRTAAMAIGVEKVRAAKNTRGLFP